MDAAGALGEWAALAGAECVALVALLLRGCLWRLNKHDSTDL